MTKLKEGRIIGLVTSIFIVIVGLMLIICAAHLFFTGGDFPYTIERVTDYLAIVMIPGIITLLLVISGLVYNAVKKESDVESTERTKKELLCSFAKRFSFESFDQETKEKALAIRKRRKTIDLIVSEFSAFCFVFILDYIFFIADFDLNDTNGDVLGALAVTLPIALVALAAHAVRIYLEEKSAAEELELLKASIKKNGAERAESSVEEIKKVDSILIARIVVVAISVIFVIIGIANGGMQDVLAKAVKICTECIGLG